MQKSRWCMILVLLFALTGVRGECPDEAKLKPHCWCLDSFHGGALLCTNFTNPNELEPPIEACQGHNVTALGIYNSTILFLPQNLFRGTSFVKITFIDTVLMSLSNGNLAFEGLEDHLIELRATQSEYVTQWQFSQLRALRRMKQIDINWIHMETIDEDLPEFPELTALGLVHTGISYITDEAFARCPKLWVLDMRYNHISELKRSMLPKPANNLAILNLEGNDISSFPTDFFTEMPALKDLYMSKNQFITLQEDTFAKMFNQLDTLDLRENLLRCDCRMLWLVERRQPVHLYAKCDEPPSLKGSQLKFLTTKYLRC